jgi:acetylglutamate kinase
MENEDKTSNEILLRSLVEALPYMQKFRDKIFVIKYGGAAQTNSELKELFAQDISLLSHMNIKIVIIHGGGKEISDISNKLGIDAKFVNGQRFTDEKTLEVVTMVLAGKINKEIVSLLNKNQLKSIGITGTDGNLMKSRQLILEDGDDLGYVGEIEEVDNQILEVLMNTGFIPVIAPIGYGIGGQQFNINADIAASKIAQSLKAEKLIYLSDVSGVIINEKTLTTLDYKTGNQYIEKGLITGGMIPKVKSAFDTIRGGVNKVHLIDGKIPHALLFEIFTDEGIGTQFVQN